MAIEAMKVIGKAVPIREARDKVTGRTEYIDDMKAVVPKEVTMLDIYRSIIPFVGLQALGLILVMIFPQIAMWLPGTMIK